KSFEGESEIQTANHSLIRLLNVPNITSTEKEMDIGETSWKVCSPVNIRGFSAVGYFFAKELLKNKKIAIGIIHSSWGATPIEAWMSANILREMPEFKQRILSLPNRERWQVMIDSINRLESDRTRI